MGDELNNNRKYIECSEKEGGGKNSKCRIKFIEAKKQKK